MVQVGFSRRLGDEGLISKGLVSFGWKWGEVVKGGKMKGEVR